MSKKLTYEDRVEMGKRLLKAEGMTEEENAKIGLVYDEAVEGMDRLIKKWGVDELTHGTPEQVAHVKIMADMHPWDQKSQASRTADESEYEYEKRCVTNIINYMKKLLAE